MIGEGAAVSAGVAVARGCPDPARRGGRGRGDRTSPGTRSAPSTRAASSTTCWRCPTTCATRSGGSSRPRLEPVEAQRPDRLRHGRLGDRRRCSRARRWATAWPADAGRPRLRAAPWTAPDRAVLCSSYSGDTEETLACFEAAEAVGARRVRRDHRRRARRGGPGGRRAGDRAARRASAARRGRLHVHRRLRGGGAGRGRLRGSGPRSTPRPPQLEERREALVARAAEIADRIAGSVPLIYGCELTVPVAYRWKTQVNENAKQHAFEHQLPELDHNEIVGWSGNGSRRVLGGLPRRLRPAPPPAPARGPDRGADRARGRTRWSGSRPRARPGSSGCSRPCCSATWSRCTSRLATGWIRTPIEVIEQLKDELGRP